MGEIEIFTISALFNLTKQRYFFSLFDLSIIFFVQGKNVQDTWSGTGLNKYEKICFVQ